MTELDSARMAPKPTRAPVAERIRLLAGRDNLSQAAVAEKLGKPQTSVSSWFRGVYDPGPDDIVALARLFGCTADYLLGMVDAPTGVDPGSWLIDLEVVDAIQSSATLVELTSRIGRSALDQGQDFAWGLKFRNEPASSAGASSRRFGTRLPNACRS